MTRFAVILLILFSTLSAKSFQVDSLPTLPANDAGKAKGLEQLGEQNITNQAFETALDFYKKANDIFISLEDTEGQLRALKGLDQAASGLKRYDEVLDYALQMQQLAAATDNKSYLAYAYARLGRIRGEMMKDLPGSRKHLFKAIDLYLEIDEKHALAKIYGDLGITYFLNQQYDSTLIFYNKSIEISKALDQKEMLHIMYSLSSELYYNTKDYDKALEYSNLALSISFDKEREDFVIFDNLLIGKIYLSKKQYQKALKYARAGTAKAEVAEDLEQTINGYTLLSEIYQKRNNLGQSIHYLQKIQPLKDSLTRSSLSLDLAEQEAAFQIQKKQQELELSKRSAVQYRQFRNGAILISALIILILVLLINRYTVAMKLQKQELDRFRTIKQLEQKEKLLLKEKVSHQEKMLAANTMHMIQKNKILDDLKTEISNLTAEKSEANFNSKIKTINRTIETNMAFDNDWQIFKLQFEQVHPHFFSKLYKSYPNLGDNEIRFFTYMKMGHNTKEIAQLSGVNASSVQKARYRLKKKMNLDKSTNLIDFIRTF